MSSSTTEFSQLNTSCSKMRYTFSKEGRFKEQMTKSSIYKFYELPSVRNGRAAGFGYGNKCGLAREAGESPSPQRYNITSLFEEDRTKKKGFVFGESRDHMKGAGILQQSNIPGPGKYEKSSTLSKISYSMRQKGSLPSLAITPGPGACMVRVDSDELPKGIDKEGIYPIAKMKNSCCSVINPEPAKRKSKVPSPGPGYYENNKVGISNNGSIVVSQCSNSRSFHFPHEGRKTFGVDSAVPGPGAYSYLSQFSGGERMPTVPSYRKQPANEKPPR